jgi:hypothetical protein
LIGNVNVIVNVNVNVIVNVIVNVNVNVNVNVSHVVAKKNGPWNGVIQIVFKNVPIDVSHQKDV